MRGLLASSIGVTCAAALALPLAPPAVAVPVPPAPTAEAATAKARPTDPDTPDLPGSTQSLPLAPLTRDRAPTGTGTSTGTGTGSGATDRGLPRRTVGNFSLLGVVWDDPDVELHGRVQVRTRPAGTDAWSDWQDLQTHNADHAPDPDSPEHNSARARGATAPLWVGDSDGVEVRVHPETPETPDAGDAPHLPTGLRLELVDPGTTTSPAPPTPTGTRALHLNAEAADTAATSASAANADLAPLDATEIPALDRARTESQLLSLRGTELTENQRARPYIGPRPRIVTRRGWGADESLRKKKFTYTKKVKAAFVHHTANGNTYKCSQAPSLIRSMYRYHVKSMGWRDIGYNFLVDKCGNIYEGRAGGVTKPVLGAHTRGFNTNSMGIAVIGTFGTTKPSAAAVRAVAGLTAWKLGLHGGNPQGKTYLTSGGGNLYGKGKNVRLHVISGHRDGFATECPGRQLYGKLGSARSTAARLQGR
ncbi:peptidoglycan recognition protein [Streptomyces sp. NPDC018693]|uniref:peptidoglycan recognition protein family protein n=1 Tax=unclassified Streptomyces TaxID=2593676 RepID=UPI00378C4625